MWFYLLISFAFTAPKKFKNKQENTGVPPSNTKFSNYERTQIGPCKVGVKYKEPIRLGDSAAVVPRGMGFENRIANLVVIYTSSHQIGHTQKIMIHGEGYSSLMIYTDHTTKEKLLVREETGHFQMFRLISGTMKHMYYQSGKVCREYITIGNFDFDSGQPVDKSETTEINHLQRSEVTYINGGNRISKYCSQGVTWEGSISYFTLPEFSGLMSFCDGFVRVFTDKYEIWQEWDKCGRFLQNLELKARRQDQIKKQDHFDNVDTIDEESDYETDSQQVEQEKTSLSYEEVESGGEDWIGVIHSKILRPRIISQNRLLRFGDVLKEALVHREDCQIFFNEFKDLKMKVKDVIDFLAPQCFKEKKAMIALLIARNYGAHEFENFQKLATRKDIYRNAKESEEHFGLEGVVERKFRYFHAYEKEKVRAMLGLGEMRILRNARNIEMHHCHEMTNGERFTHVIEKAEEFM